MDMMVQTTGFAANQELMQHYCSTYNAEAICMLYPYQIFITEEEGAKNIGGV